MKSRNLLIALAGLLVAGAQGQIAVPPFVGLPESFEAFAPGYYTGMVGFGGGATLSRIGGGMLWVTTGKKCAGLQSMVGDQADLQIAFTSLKFRFGGFMLYGGDAPQAKVCFYKKGAPVGVPVIVGLTATWQWAGWAVPGGFDQVRIYGIGGVVAGWVYLDALRVN